MTPTSPTGPASKGRQAKRSAPRSATPRNALPKPSRAPRDAHEWVSFPDPEELRTWMFDVTFLESRWTCIYGRGCQGVLTEAAPELEHGCCSYGAHFTGAKDARRVEAVAATLTPAQWQFWRQGQPRRDRRPRVVKRSRSGALTTRIVQDACIFLNRPGFPGGAGCALHRAALERGESLLAMKPDVCWQLPLRREDEVAEDGYVTSVVRQWDRRDWGPGGDEFHWWCTEAPDAFVGSRPAYLGLEEELIGMVGRKIYRRLVGYLEARHSPERGSASATVVALPHPALRQRNAAGDRR
jgi:hypothetical protein